MERGITVAEYVSHAVTFPLLTHEGFHQFLYHCAYPRVPAWLNEGLAVMCEGSAGVTSAWWNSIRGTIRGGETRWPRL